MTSQNHFTLSFPLKLPADAKAMAVDLPPLMPELFQAADRIGTIHYSRFTILSEKTLLFLADFDGEFAHLMDDLARHAGSVFDLIFQHVEIRRQRRWPRIPMLLSNGRRNTWCMR